jgi:mRNA-degrading endonuclease RelE of RelBE toxin-antitoxin system
MPFEIRYSNEAVEQLKKLRAFDRTAILDQIEQVLTVNPTIVTKARIKHLREPAPTEYRFGSASSVSFTTWRTKSSSSFRC